MNLLQKLLEIRKAMPFLKKEAVNQGQGFNYVSSSQVLGIFREKADELGVLIVPRVTNGTCGEKGKQLLVELYIDYEVVNVEDPKDKINIPFYAQGLDMGEKGVGKALTYGEKYLILKLFNVPTDKDDPDAGAKPSTTSTDVPAGPDEATVKFLEAMKTIEKKFIERDNSSVAINMTLKMSNYEKAEDVKPDDRGKIVKALLAELGVEKVSDL